MGRGSSSRYGREAPRPLLYGKRTPVEVRAEGRDEALLAEIARRRTCWSRLRGSALADGLEQAGLCSLWRVYQHGDEQEQTSLHLAAVFAENQQAHLLLLEEEFSLSQKRRVRSWNTASSRDMDEILARLNRQLVRVGKSGQPLARKDIERQIYQR